MSSERLLKIVTVVTVLTDIVLIFAAFGIAYVIRYQLQWFRDVDPAYFTTFLPYLPMAALQSALTLIAFALEGVFRPKRGASLADEVYGVINGVTTGFVVEVFILFFWRPLVYSRLIFVYATALIMLFIILARVVRRSVLSYLRSRGMGLDRVLIVGAENIGLTVMRNLIAQPELGFEVVGFVDDNPARGQTDIGRFKALGGSDRLPQLLGEEAIDEVIVALPWNERRKILNIVNLCVRSNVRPRVVPDLFQISLSMVDMRNMAGIPMLSLHEPTLSPWARAFKRFIDLFGAGIGLILLSPFLLIIALAIRLDSRGPALFRQYRVGRYGKQFQVVKFRSMVRDAEALKGEVSHLNEAQGAMFKIREDPRVTRTGRFLRRTSLDELPQLWNVLRGDMSLVGPRPALPEEVAEYAEWHRQRLATAPGMTGLWQVSGRSELPFDEMVLLDIYYVENWSPFLDLSILLRTVPLILSGSGAY